MKPEPDLEHFKSIPWCKDLLENQEYTITPTFSRQVKYDTEDSLIAETLFSPNTISHCLSVYRNPPPESEITDEVISLLTLSSGMNGSAHVLHGGIVAALLDDVMGTLLTVNKVKSSGNSSTASTVTAKLVVEYKVPVRTPQTIMVMARMERIEGRRLWLVGEMKDAAGRTLAKSEAVWVRVEKGGRAREQKKMGNERL